MSYEPPRCMAVVEPDERTEVVCQDVRILVVAPDDRVESVESEVRVCEVEKDVYSP